MSNKIVTYTAEEQQDLTSLAGTERVLKNTLSLLQNGMFVGNASLAVLECSQFVESLVKQTTEQRERIEKAAKARSEASEEPKLAKAN